VEIDVRRVMICVRRLLIGIDQRIGIKWFWFREEKGASGRERGACSHERRKRGQRCTSG